jgi:hypothetical protein
MIAPMNGRPVRESRSEYTYVALPNNANPLGTSSAAVSCTWLTCVLGLQRNDTRAVRWSQPLSTR